MLNIADDITRVPDKIKNCNNLVEINLEYTSFTEDECK
jgi:hypothetical protein